MNELKDETADEMFVQFHDAILLYWREQFANNTYITQ